MLKINDSKRKNGLIKIIITIGLRIIDFPSDWSCIASLVILSIGRNRGQFLKQIIWSMVYVALYSLVYILAIDMTYGIIQLGVVIDIMPLALYNGKKSPNEKLNKIMKWSFYIYYPLHLLIIGLIGLL